MASLFPCRISTGCVYFTRARYFTSQKGITTSETNPKTLVIYFFNNKANTHFSQEESRLSRIGWFLH